MKPLSLRKILPWLVAIAVLAPVVYRLKFAAVPVAAHTVATGEVRAEVMGTGTLDTHFKAAASPKVFQSRLVQVLVDQNAFVTNSQLLAVLGISVLASLLGIWKAMRISPNTVLA